MIVVVFVFERRREYKFECEFGSERVSVCEAVRVVGMKASKVPSQQRFFL